MNVTGVSSAKYSRPKIFKRQILTTIIYFQITRASCSGLRESLHRRINKCRRVIKRGRMQQMPLSPNVPILQDVILNVLILWTEAMNKAIL